MIKVVPSVMIKNIELRFARSCEQTADAATQRFLFVYFSRLGRPGNLNSYTIHIFSLHNHLTNYQYPTPCTLTLSFFPVVWTVSG